jgi:hypothetical protein
MRSPSSRCGVAVGEEIDVAAADAGHGGAEARGQESSRRASAGERLLGDEDPAKIEDAAIELEVLFAGGRRAAPWPRARSFSSPTT